MTTATLPMTEKSKTQRELADERRFDLFCEAEDLMHGAIRERGSCAFPILAEKAMQEVGTYEAYERLQERLFELQAEAEEMAINALRDSSFGPAFDVLAQAAMQSYGVHEEWSKLTAEFEELTEKYELDKE